MATDNENKILNVPNLRFPEFTEEWKKTKIGDITSKVGSGVTPKGGSAVYKTSGHLFIRSQNVGNGCFLLDDVAYIDEATHKKQINTELKEGDVLLNITGASIGRTTVVNKNIEGGNVNQHVCIIRLLEDFSPNYICNYLLSYGGQKQIDSFQAGGNREGLNFEQIRSIKFSVPSFKEQSKIASLLSLLDERIATQSKIIEDLKKLKSAISKCIFQDVLKQNEIVQLGDIANIYQPQTIPTSALNDNYPYAVYGANGMIGKYLEYNHETSQICVTCRGNTCGAINYTTPKSWITGNAMVINTDAYNVNKRFIYHQLCSVNFNPLISGSGQPQIVRSPLEKMKIWCPVADTQQKIANILDKLEVKVSVESTIKDRFLEQKRHLLSQMFI